MVEDALNRIAVRFALVIVAALLAVSGGAFLLLAIFLGLADELDETAAAFLTGAIAVLGAVAIILALRFGQIGGAGKKPRPSVRKAGLSDAEATAMAGAMGAELGTWIKANSRTAVIGAFLAGIVLGASPQARTGLWDLIKTATGGRKPRG